MIEYLPLAPGEDHCCIAQRVCSHPCLKTLPSAPKHVLSTLRLLTCSGQAGREMQTRDAAQSGPGVPLPPLPTRGDVEDLNPRWLLLACRGSPPHATRAGSSFYLDSHPRAGAFITALGEENTHKKLAFFWVK